VVVLVGVSSAAGNAFADEKAPADLEVTVAGTTSIMDVNER